MAIHIKSKQIFPEKSYPTPEFYNNVNIPKTIPLVVSFLMAFFTINLLWGSTFNWDIRGEIGLHRTEDYAKSYGLEPFSRLSASLKYKDSYRQNMWFVRAQVKPEIYDVDADVTSLKFYGEAQFRRQYPNWNWSVNLHSRRYQYNMGSTDIAMTTQRISPKIFRKLTPDLFFFLNTGYMNRKISNQYQQNLNTAFVQPSFHYVFSRYLNFTGGLFLEKFHLNLSEDVHSDDSRTDNPGWRLGPEATVEFKQRLYFSLSYRYLWHFSEISPQPAYEQHVRMVFGKLLSERWSVFFLTDYYFTQFSIDEKNIHLSYTPVDNQNQFHLKLEYEASAKTAIYMKFGYLNEELFFRDFSITGWQGAIGMNIEK